MPTPRQHGGAALQMIPLVTPGFMGLNTQGASSILGPEWATYLSNAALDENSRLAARKGYSSLGGTGGSAKYCDAKEIFESDGSTSLLALNRETDVYQYSTNGGASWSGTTTAIVFDSIYDSSIISFNDKGYVFTQKTSGQAGIQWDPAAPTVDTAINDTNMPRSGIVWAAFGRLWGVMADGHTLRYSALLDGTDWDGADAGSIDLWNVWSENDRITGGCAHNGALVVFGERNIAMWTDGSGSQLGIDPTQMYVFDTTQGVGCITRHSIQHIDGDVWFLSKYGLQSLSRTVQEKSNPLNNLSTNIQDEFMADVFAATTNYIRSVYSPKDKLYLLSLSSGGSTESGTCYAFDTRGRLQDGAVRSLGEWTLVPSCALYASNNTLIMWVLGDSDFGTYSGTTDRSAAYTFRYESGWMDLTQQGFLIMPKRYGGVFVADADANVKFLWAFDFDDTFKSRTKSFQVESASLYGTAVWGTDLWGGGASLRQGKIQPSGNGEYIKLGLQVEISGLNFATQQLELFCKIGRYA